MERYRNFSQNKKTGAKILGVFIVLVVLACLIIFLILPLVILWPYPLGCEWENDGTCMDNKQKQKCGEATREIECTSTNCVQTVWENDGKCVNNLQKQIRTTTTEEANGGTKCGDLTKEIACVPEEVIYGEWTNCVIADNDINNGKRSTQTREVTIGQNKQTQSQSCYPERASNDCLWGNFTNYSNWTSCDGGEANQTRTYDRGILRVQTGNGKPCGGGYSSE